MENLKKLTEAVLASQQNVQQHIGGLKLTPQKSGELWDTVCGLCFAVQNRAKAQTLNELEEKGELEDA